MEEALSKHDYSVVKRLLKDKKKKHANQRYFNNQTALHVACDYGDVAMAKLLLKHKADVNDIDDSNQTPLHIAAKQGNLQMVLLLLKKSATVSIPSFQGNTPLHFLVGHNFESITSEFICVLDKLKTAGAPINGRNSHGETPLHCAALKNCEKNAMWLIRQGADVSICNKKGETALHYASLYCSKSFVSLLIKVGACPDKESDDGSSRNYAINAKREEIVDLFAQTSRRNSGTSIRLDGITINGSEITKLKLQHYKKLLEEETTESDSKSPRRPRARTRTCLSESNDVTVSRNQLLQAVIEINLALFEGEEQEEGAWKGTLRLPDKKSTDGWSSEYCSIEDYKIKPLREGLEVISFRDAVSFRVYVEAPSHFGIVFYQNSMETVKRIGAQWGISQILLKKLVLATRKPIEYVNEQPLLSVLNEIKETPKIRQKSPRTHIQVKRRKSLNGYSARLLGNSASVSVSADQRRITVSTSAASLENIPTPIVNEKGHILCATDFTFDLYSRVFSEFLQLKPEPENRYSLISGTICDLLHYSILHSGIRAFRSNIDVKSFYLNYYKYCEPQDIISKIESIWELHTEVRWPSPYNSVSCEFRLFVFLRGFIKSPFVLTDFEKEIQFREDLASLFGLLVPSPQKQKHSVQSLQDIVLKTKQERRNASVNQLCDLNSLLRQDSGDAETITAAAFNVHKLDVDTIVSQIVCINADLYKQLQIAELLDLRYQKDKTFATSLNKVHEFSNKIYLVVPTTILQSDDIAIQKATLKKWVLIAEKLFNLRDYNSTIQLINGITESSVMRLQHLKGSLSVKWIERFEKLKEAFDPLGNFANYRKLSTAPPCIPFVGVALKDLVFACEANPDKAENEGINFQKMRMITEIIKSLKVEQNQQTDYSFLNFEPKIAQSILNAIPMTQDELYERSKEISKQIQELEEDETFALKKRISALEAEVARLKEANNEKDQQIFLLQQQNKLSSNAKRRLSPHHVYGISPSSEPELEICPSPVEKGIRFG